MSNGTNNEAPLPDDLAALERQLAERQKPHPPAHLRDRVLATVASELARLPHAEGIGWGWVVGIAAAVLIGINFSASVVNNMDWHFADRLRRDDIAATARQVQQLVPEMSRGEAFRQALLLRAGAPIALGPVCQMSLHQLLHQRERQSWDTP